MLFNETKLAGAMVIEIEPIADERGFFARSFCRDEFTRQGLNPSVSQYNYSHNHGFEVLEDDTLVFYRMSEFYAPDFAGGVRWNDPAFKISRPAAEKIIAAKDQQWPDYRA